MKALVPPMLYNKNMLLCTISTTVVKKIRCINDRFISM